MRIHLDAFCVGLHLQPIRLCSCSDAFCWRSQLLVLGLAYLCDERNVQRALSEVIPQRLTGLILGSQNRIWASRDQNVNQDFGSFHDCDRSMHEHAQWIEHMPSAPGRLFERMRTMCRCRVSCRPSKTLCIIACTTSHWCTQPVGSVFPTVPK